ncbi:MAG: hypothetical protein INQ03_10655 [Candidatus Heimdallarchaeota archaeon]|nr:hypothetical protein [Candidatus Heimdallarchaeota archaeon]
MQIASTVLLHVNNGFLNGSGNGKDRDGDINQVKQLQIAGTSYPFISAQALRKWYRAHLQFNLSGDDYYQRILFSPKKKDISGLNSLIGDPINQIEDDVFGYSRPIYDKANIGDENRYNIAAINRHGPFKSSMILPVENQNNMIQKVEGFVHLHNDTTLPYRNEFTNGYMFYTSALELDRIGRFRNESDKFELDPQLLEIYKKKKLVLTNDREIELVNRTSRIEMALEWYCDALLSVNNLVKDSQFAADLTPRAVFISLIKGSSNPFYNLYTTDNLGRISINWENLEHIINNRKHTFLSPIYFGIRSNAIKITRNQIKRLADLDIVVDSPGIVVRKLKNAIKEEFI